MMRNVIENSAVKQVRESTVKSHRNMKQTCCGYCFANSTSLIYSLFSILLCFFVCLYVHVYVRMVCCVLIKGILHGKTLIDSSILISRLVFSNNSIIYAVILHVKWAQEKYNKYSELSNKYSTDIMIDTIHYVWYIK